MCGAQCKDQILIVVCNVKGKMGSVKKVFRMYNIPNKTKVIWVDPREFDFDFDFEDIFFTLIIFQFW